MRFGRYELIEPIGAGGMAEVFLAIRRGPRGVAKRLVIKRIAHTRVRDPQSVRLFEREARIGCELSHSNLVSVFEFGRVSDHWFIAMEYIAGCDLGVALDRARGLGAPAPPALIAHIAAEVCRGLGHVHAHGYVHRDVTPRNVLLSWDGLVKLSDYGLTQPCAATPEPDRAVRGTRSFMSPEQAAAGPLDGRADVYSVGALIAHAGTVDDRLAAIAATATAQDPAARFASADALRAALVPIATGVDDRALAGWLAPLRPRPEPAPDAAVAAPRAAAGAAAAGTSTTIDGAAAAPLAPLDALLARPPRRRRRRAWWLGAAALAALAAVELAVMTDRRTATAGAATTGAAVPAEVRCVEGDGYYCGRSLRRYSVAPPGAIDDDTLYLCDHGRARVKEICEHGCDVRPPGQADICNWRPPETPRRHRDPTLAAPPTQ